MIEKFGIDHTDFVDSQKEKEPLLRETLLHVSKSSLLSKTILKMKSALLEHDDMQLKHQLKEQQLL